MSVEAHVGDMDRYPVHVAIRKGGRLAEVAVKCRSLHAEVRVVCPSCHVDDLRDPSAARNWPFATADAACMRLLDR